MLFLQFRGGHPQSLHDAFIQLARRVMLQRFGGEGEAQVVAALASIGIGGLPLVGADEGRQFDLPAGFFAGLADFIYPTVRTLMAGKPWVGVWKGVGSFGSIVHYDGNEWREVTAQEIGSPYLRTFHRVHGSSRTDVWVVGSQAGEGGITPLVWRYLPD